MYATCKYQPIFNAGGGGWGEERSVCKNSNGIWSQNYHKKLVERIVIDQIYTMSNIKEGKLNA